MKLLIPPSGSLSAGTLKKPISNERLSVSTEAGETTVHLRAKQDGKSTERTFSILEFLAELQQHIPDTWEQTSRYMGVYSCRSRGEQKKSAKPLMCPYLPERESAPSQNWAACMKRVFEIDPLLCPKCRSEMKIIPLRSPSYGGTRSLHH